MSVPSRMRVVVHATGDPLQIVEAPTPSPQEDEVLIKVAAAGVNRPDLLQRDGLYPPPPGAPVTLGLEAAGEIVAVGPGVERWRVGDWTTALLSGGGYAEYAIAAAKCCLPIPKGLNPVQAASLPEAAFTVWTNVFEIGRLQAGETLLVHGAGSGIGVMAIQLARARKAKVIATVRDDPKVESIKKLGVAHVINTRTHDFEAQVRDLGSVDVVLDMVGGAYLQPNLNVLKEGGRLVIIGFMQGPTGDVNLTRVLLKRLTIAGSTLRSRAIAEKARLAVEVEKNVWPAIAAGRVKPVIDGVYPLEEAEAAHARMRAGGHIGKIVLVPQ
jgi:putative PIG3 family NAD(P)H quinone oxidoreductase